MDRTDQFIAVARSFIGVPWRHQGRSRKGVDCVGLVVLSARACGVPVSLLATYGRTPYYPEAKKELMKFGKREASIFPGAVVIYKQTVMHMAIATDAGTIIQAINTVGRVTECSINFVPSQFWRFEWPS